MKKEEKKTKTENAGKFSKPRKIFAGVAKFSNPCEKISQPSAKFRSPLRNFVEPLHPKFHQTSISHNFFIRTLIHTFLDSMEISMRLKPNHMAFNSISFSHIF